MVVVNLHKRSTRESVITWQKKHIGSLLERVILKLEIESVLESEDYKILWDFSIQTDHFKESRRPDLVVIDKKERSCKIIDFAVPADSRIEEKKKDQKENHKDL